MHAVQEIAAYVGRNEIVKLECVCIWAEYTVVQAEETIILEFPMCAHEIMQGQIGTVNATLQLWQAKIEYNLMNPNLFCLV